ncbi:MAG: hypothetical protein HY975_01730 [Candidatus Kerfeldbacteria bacterium]|nr:hypothetical protein [Candidatus Kerfeldbacteria bacterium]
MPFLKKVINGSKDKVVVPPRPLADSVFKTLTVFSRPDKTQPTEEVAMIEVHDTISNVAWAYEKLRQAIDYQDEHLLRKNAIERIIKRRLVAGATAESIAEPLILELIRGRYLPNKALPVTIITDVGDVINSYIHLWTQVPTAANREDTDKLFSWYLGLMAVQLNELLAPTEKEEALIKLMFETTHRDIAFAEDHISESEKNTQIYVAIHRALLKSDTNIIRYHLFARRHPEWNRPTPEVIAALGHQFPQIRHDIETQLRHPAGELLQRLMKKYAIAFLVFYDVARQHGTAAAEEMTHPDKLSDDIKAAYNDRKKKVNGKIARSVIRSIIYVFLTKMLLLVLIELPVERLVYTDVNNMLPLIINVAFPPLLLLLLGVSIRPAGKKNELAVVEKVQALVYRGDERHALVKPRKPIRRSTFFASLFRVIYTLTFFLVFGLIIWGLQRLDFTPISMFIFLLFLSIVSFFGIRVRLLAKELLVVDQRENIFTVLFDFFTVPILQVGRWISLRVPKINVMIFFLDVIIEAPFKAFLEATEGFFGFLREKREEIY